MNEYVFAGRRGIDDLKGILPEQGTEWWTKDQWKEWERKRPAFKRFNRMYINWLKRNNLYGEEYNISLMIEPNPPFDPISAFVEQPIQLTSYRMVFL